MGDFANPTAGKGFQMARCRQAKKRIGERKRVVPESDHEIGEAAIQAGNSEGIIRRHYLDLKSAQEAEDYWSIFPKRATPQATLLEVLPAPAFLCARQANSAA
jgi:hypothetical protein